jgi:hypothetical protein
MSECEFVVQQIWICLERTGKTKKPKQQDCEIPLSNSPKTLLSRKQELSRENENACRKKDVM